MWQLQLDASQAKTDFDYVLSLLSAWSECWPVVAAWYRGLKALEAIYKLVYTTTILQSVSTSRAASEPANTASLDRVDPDTVELQEGDGLPDLTVVPNGLYYTLRIIIGLALDNAGVSERILANARDMSSLADLPPDFALFRADEIWNDDLWMDS